MALNCIYNEAEHTLTAQLPERLTTANCAREERALLEALESAGSEGNRPLVLLDAAQTRYISSMGIRVLLKLQKSGAETVVLNARPELYEILTMTGVDNVISVFTPFQTLSVTGRRRIGDGRNGAVYRLDGERICKVFRKKNTLRDILLEKRRSRQAFQLGLPTALSFQVARVGDGYGLVYEQLGSKTLSEMLLEPNADVEKIIGGYADFLIDINRTEAPKFPDKKAEYVRRVVAPLSGALEPPLAQALARVAGGVPDGGGFVHGDPHFANIMLVEGEMTMVDMNDAGCGDGIWDLAALRGTLVDFQNVAPTDVLHLGGTERYLELWRSVLAAWCDRRGEAPRDVEARVSVLSAARVAANALRHRIGQPLEKKAVELLRQAMEGEGLGIRH